MNTLRKTLTIIGLLLIGTSSFGVSLPTLHAMGEHHHVMLQIPASVHPVKVKVTNAQQQMLFHLTIDAVEGIFQKLDFSQLPAGHYAVEVEVSGQSFYKSVYVLADRVSVLDATLQFRTTPYSQL